MLAASNSRLLNSPGSRLGGLWPPTLSPTFAWLQQLAAATRDGRGVLSTLADPSLVATACTTASLIPNSPLYSHPLAQPLPGSALCSCSSRRGLARLFAAARRPAVHSFSGKQPLSPPGLCASGTGMLCRHRPLQVILSPLCACVCVLPAGLCAAQTLRAQHGTFFSLHVGFATPHSRHHKLSQTLI